MEAVGFSGGIWIFWKKEVVLDVMCTNPQFILLKVASAGDSHWLLSVVYGSPNGMLRDKLWEDLSSSNFNLGGPWLFIGDYNAVVSGDKVSSSGSLAHYRCGKFQDWIFRHGLIDLGFTGPIYTWFRGLNSSTFKGARLDRGLCSVDWRNAFLDASLSHLPRAQSDHIPMMVRLKGTSQSPMVLPFRFQMAWFSHIEFKQVVETEWEGDGPLEQKVSRLASSLSQWNIIVFGNIYKQKRRILA